MSLSALKLATLNTNRKQTSQQVSNAISQLNAHAAAAMKQQAYMHKDPDLNGAGDLIAVVQPEFDALSVAFNQVAAKLVDMQAVSAGTMTADALIAKYNIDLNAFSNTLV